VIPPEWAYLDGRDLLLSGLATQGFRVDLEVMGGLVNGPKLHRGHL
jgi:hypothetical protein